MRRLAHVRPHVGHRQQRWSHAARVWCTDRNGCGERHGVVCMSTTHGLPVTMMPSKVSFQPIDVTEVADRLVTMAAAPAAGRVPDLGGPQVRDAAELARGYLRAIGRRRAVWSIPLPGKAMRDYRAGNHLAPQRAIGRITFDEFVAGVARERNGR